MKKISLLIILIAIGLMINACADDSGGSKKEKVERLHDNSKDAGKDKKTIKEELVILETNQGNIEIRLFRDIAPKACENFVGLVKKGYYNGIIFHRVIPGFMIQGGDPTGTGMGGESIWGGNFEDEVTSSVTFDRPGLVAMANAGPGTNGSQFFITTGKALWLNMKHTIFGQVINKESYDVVQKIEDISTDSNDKPKSPQTIIKAHHEVP